MKRIAVAVDNNDVSSHFGLCENFLIFDTEDGKISKIEKLANPGHRACTFPEFIETFKVDLVIVGNMGKTAASRFKLLQIPYIVGVEGEAESVVSLYLDGKLNSKGELCDAWTCQFFDHSNA